MKCAAVLILLFLGNSVFAQDPSFSQFFSSPLNINPALTGNINGDWRIVSNFRDQWIGPASPYVTGTVSYDRKILQHKLPGVPENNVVGIGGMFMYDYAMSGIVKSTYASANLSYSLKLAEGDVSTHRLTAGFGAIYGYRYVDLSRLDFEEQFTGYGFNTNLPTGELALSNMKPYFSVSSGLLYSVKSERSNLDIGAAGFHLNNPKQTFLEDEQQRPAILGIEHVLQLRQGRHPRLQGRLCLGLALRSEVERVAGIHILQMELPAIGDPERLGELPGAFDDLFQLHGRWKVWS